jgi:hypothetical protein
MAIEDEIINISDIDVGTEILKSDKLLIETSNGTKMLAFKDFVVGPDNISSIRQDQIEKNNAAAAGGGAEATAHYSTVSGFEILTNATTFGLNTEYNQISGTIELGKFNYNAIAHLASVSADIATNDSRINALEDNFSALDSFIRDTDLSSVTITNSACNFEVTGGHRPNIKSHAVGFTKAELDPSSTNKNASLELAPFKITFPSTGGGFEASYFLLDGTFSGTTLFGRRKTSADITIYIDDSEGNSRPVFSMTGRPTNTASKTTITDFNFQKVVRIKPGESIRVSSNDYIRTGTLLGFKL